MFVTIWFLRKSMKLHKAIEHDSINTEPPWIYGPYGTQTFLYAAPKLQW